ncbi:MAG: hypothetical protein LKJ88_01310 [Bacilli bacterium]|jgi:uncharacterized protein YxjI|nr:hypothetical protein [Bacilli bacterium]
MDFIIHQHILSTIKKYDIYDEQGKVCYTTEGKAKGQFIVMGEQIHLFDLNGKEVAFVHERFPNLIGKYDLIINGELKGRIVGKISFMHPRYKVDFMGYRIEGDVLGFNFKLYQKDRYVATMVPKMISVGTAYSLSVADKEDEIPALTLSIAIAGMGASGMVAWDFILPTN